MDDVVRVLGERVARKFAFYLSMPEQRVGQAFINSLDKVDFDKVLNTPYDIFYERDDGASWFMIPSILIYLRG